MVLVNIIQPGKFALKWAIENIDERINPTLKWSIENTDERINHALKLGDNCIVLKLRWHQLGI